MEWIDASIEVPINEDEVLVCTKSKNGARNIDKGYYAHGRWAHRGCAEVTHTLTEMFSGEKETETPVAAAPEAPAEVKKEYSFIEVRAALTEKSRAGKTAEVKALLRKHGADKLSEIKPEEYAALVEEAEGL